MCFSLVLASRSANRIHGRDARGDRRRVPRAAARRRHPSLSFDERLGMLVDAEQLARDTRALTRRLKEAKLRLSHACLEDLDYTGRKLDRAVIRQLATCRWVAEHHNILITGPTGVGKTFVACALGQQACRQ